jgi:hypothetical protein
LLCFRVRLPDPLPQPLQGVGPGLGTQPVIRAEPLHDGLNDLFLNLIGTRFPFPVIEHFGESADDGYIVVPVLMFETEKFA